MAAGQLPNPIPAMFEYLPLEHPTVVISPYFLAQYPVDLWVMAYNDSTVMDLNGTVIFGIKNKHLSLHNRRKLMDTSGNVLVSMSQKIMTKHGRWKSFRGESKDLLFSVKRSSSMLQRETNLDVFLAGNTTEQVPDFRIKGACRESSCIIYLRNTNQIVARMYRDRNTKAKSFRVTIYPNVDYAFIISLSVLTINELNEYRRAEEYHGQNAAGLDFGQNIP
ncbi:Protein LURP-one-related 15 [Linum grandiflorum]